MEPAELSSLKSVLNVARILALVFLILFLLAGIGELLAVLVLISPGLGAIALVYVAFFILAFIVAILVYMQIAGIKRMVDAGQYQAAKDRTLIWMILGFIFGIILGIVLLIAYLKFDAVINWQRQMQSGGQPPAQPPAWGAPPPAAPPMAPVAVAAPSPAAPPMPVAAPGAPAAGICPRCGKPATWVAQYNRWYCYNDQQYI